MNKAFIFVFGGTAVIYYACFSGSHKFNLPSVADIKTQYEVKKIQNENIQLKLKLQKAEFTLARMQEGSNAGRNIASTPKTFELFPVGKKIEDHVMQEVYHWSPTKLIALSEREYKLKNYAASASNCITRFTAVRANQSCSCAINLFI